MPAGWAAGIGAVAGGLLSAGGAEAGAAQQAAYERAALAQQEQMFGEIQANEQPFIQGGQAAESQLNYLMGEGKPGSYGTSSSSSAGGYGSLAQPFNAQTFQQQSPQYQFNLQQGQQNTLNQSASSQGAESGAALSGLESFNQSYANNSYNSAFNNYQTQQNNIFGRLSGLATLGSNAGSNQATGASSFASSIGNTQAGIGSALGAGTVAAGNALGQGASSLSGILGAGGTGSTVGYNPNTSTDPSSWSSPNSSYQGNGGYIDPNGPSPF
jgi:hypothetical protein